MSERDLAQLAARSLREAHDGQRAGAGFTKARIIKTLHERRRRRRAVWVVLGPLFAVFVGSTAWAQVTGRWPVWVEQAVLLFTAEKVSLPAETAAIDEPRLPAKRGQVKGTPPSEASDESADEAGDTPPVAQTVADEAPKTPDEPVVVAQAEHRSAHSEALGSVERSNGEPGAQRAKSRPSVSGEELTQEPSSEAESSSAATGSSEPVQSKPTLDADPEFRAFRAGHDQHYRANDPAGAIIAYRRYLQDYPRGRFVPEARYNIALNSLRLGRKEDAKRILDAFADGRYGAYRQVEARALLDAME